MLDIKQKKKHLLLLNKILRSEIKSELIPIPSKLSEEEVNKYFDRLFIKKSEDGVDYYVPIKNKLEISVDEDLFKSLLVKKKKVVTKEEKQLADEERLKKLAVNVYNKFNKEVIEPYAIKRKKGDNVDKEEKELIRRYVKFNKYVKELVKKNWKNLYMRVLEPLEKERSQRKENLKEEDEKLMIDIKDKAKEEKKTEPEKVIEEPKQEIIQEIKKTRYDYLKDIKLRPLKDLKDITKISIDDLKYVPLEQLNDIYKKNPLIWYDLSTDNRREIGKIITDYGFLNNELRKKAQEREKKFIEEYNKELEKEREIEKQTKNEIVDLTKKELVKEIIKQPEEIIKKGDYQYDNNYFSSFEMIEKSDRGVRTNEEKLKIKTMLARLQFQYDLYTTPIHCIDTIFNNMLKDKNLHNKEINILEPSAGTGRFIRYLIDNRSKLKINNLDANEYSFDLFNLLKDKVKIDNIYNRDFLYFDETTKDYKYDLIVMNPPYRGTVSGVNEPEYYKYHLIKAILLNKNKKVIYLISPNLSGSSSENMGNINLKLNDSLLKRVNKFFKFDFNNDMPNYEINKIGECDGFIKFTKNGTTKMQQSFNIYKINVN